MTTADRSTASEERSHVSLGASPVLRDKVYLDLRHAMMAGKFVPGQKITIRQLAASLGTSLTPIREALLRLTAEGALEDRPNRSLRIPIMTQAKILELRDIRMAIEGLAAERAADRMEAGQIARLRSISLEIGAARDRGDWATDIAKVGEWQFTVYHAANMPALMGMIEGVWLRTGPYMNLLFPDFVRQRPREWRARVAQAIERRDAAAAAHEVRTDIDQVMNYIAARADADGRIYPPRGTLPLQFDPLLLQTPG